MKETEMSEGMIHQCNRLLKYIIEVSTFTEGRVMISETVF
jgi:hypothetical protein